MLAPPIRLTGVQRSGKTSAAKVICLLRMLLIPDHRVLACTPHLEPENGYPQAFQVVGHRGSGRRDMEAIESSWNQIQGHIENGRKLNLSAIFDEFGSYSDGFSDPESLTVSLRSMLREATKHQLFPIIVIHGESKAFVSGSAGLFQVLMSSTVRLETIGEAIGDLGQVRPTGKIRIKWLDGSSEELKFPDWLTEDLLISLLPHPGYHPSPAPIGAADRAHLESCLAASPAPTAATTHPEAESSTDTDRIIEDGDPVEDCILKFLGKRGKKGALVGDLIAHRAKALEGMNSEDLRFYLVLLQEERKVRSEGSRWFLP